MQQTQSSLMVNPKNLDDEYTDVLWSIFAPYSTTLWLCVGASLALQIFIASFVRLTEFRLGLQQKMNTFEVIFFRKNYYYYFLGDLANASNAIVPVARNRLLHVCG